jgi:hypothetical protein
VTTRLEGPLKREIAVDGEPYTLTREASATKRARK